MDIWNVSCIRKIKTSGLGSVIANSILSELDSNFKPKSLLLLLIRIYTFDYGDQDKSCGLKLIY